MSFNDFLNNAWNDHAANAKEVAGRFTEGMTLLEKNEQIPALANIITHVMGEHLGEWDNGVALLKKLRGCPVFTAESESENAIVLSVASLEVAGGKRGSVDDFSLSNQIRILAIAASALSEKDAGRAQILFRSALEKASSGLAKEDAANRALAITGNNLACALEEKKLRSFPETELMILAAQTGRKFWEVAGTWLETERAEYRLSHTYLKAGQIDKSIKHALLCLDICTSNNADSLEFFFGFEALALAFKEQTNFPGFNEAVANAKKHYEKMSADNKPWCEGSLKKLTA